MKSRTTLASAVRQLCCALWALIFLLGGHYAGADSGEYLLGPGDVVRITVFQNPDLTTETRVSESGSVTFPLLGPVSVGGLTISAAEQTVARRLREGGFVLQPQVNLLLLQIRGNQVAVLGHVNRPGRFPLETFTAKVTDILALAGGITPSGADTAVLVGSRAGKPIRKEIDVPALFLHNRLAEDITIAAGDILYVHRAPVYYIYGEVQRPGAYRLERDMTVMQALAQGGGLTLRGTEKGLLVHRRSADGAIATLQPLLSDRIQPDDVVYLKESLF